MMTWPSRAAHLPQRSVVARPGWPSEGPGPRSSLRSSRASGKRRFLFMVARSGALTPDLSSALREPEKSNGLKFVNVCINSGRMIVSLREVKSGLGAITPPSIQSGTCYQSGVLRLYCL